MQADTGLPKYLPYPCFLLRAGLSRTAELLYALLLERSLLSQANEWTDEDGRVYLLFPIEKLAAAIGRGKAAVKEALSELEAADLIERRRQGLTKPNRIYLKLPADGQEVTPAADEAPCTHASEAPPVGGESAADGQKTSLPDGRKTSLPDGRKTSSLMAGKPALMTAGKPATNNLSNNNLRNNNLRLNNLSGVQGAQGAREAYGRYANVFLTDGEYAELQRDYPGRAGPLIERLSMFMQSTGRRYRSHAATIRLWAEDDRKKNGGIPDYRCEEGESL